MAYKAGGLVIKQDPPTIPTALWVLQFLFGFHGFVLYRWLRPSWNPWRDPTAETAKARLAWCVKARRDGGYWVVSGYEEMRLWLFGRMDPLIVDGRPNRWRWVNA